MEVRRLQRKEYKYWIKNIHYAKRLPNVMFAFGLILEKKIHGVCTFGMPPSSTLQKSIAGDNYKDIVLQLNRLVTYDNLKKNTLSQFLMKSIKLLKKPKIMRGPKIKLLKFLKLGIFNTQLLEPSAKKRK